MGIRTLWNGAVVASLALALGACGSSSPSSPSGGGTGGGGTGGGGTGGGGTGGGTPVATTTITITANGVSPASIVVTPGSRVTFVNNDSRQHEMNSDPHPEHTDCPALNDVGFLSPGQTRLSGNLNTPRTCRYHDHNDPFNTRWLGSILIQ